MKRFLVLFAGVIVFMVEAQCSYLLSWNAEKEAYYLGLTFSYDNPNGPDVEKTNHFLRAGTKWYHDRYITVDGSTEDARTAYGEWSFALEDEEKIDSITVTIYTSVSSKSNSEQRSYFSTDSTISSTAYYSSSDLIYYLGDSAYSGDDFIGYNTSTAGSATYSKTYTDLDVATVYVLHWIRDLNDDNYTAINKIELTATAVPEPATMLLLAFGTAAFGFSRKRK